MIQVLIVDDHPAVGEGTRNIIEQQEDMEAEVLIDSELVFERLREKNYDVYILDLYMPKMNGVELSKLILQDDPEAIILIYTGFDIMSHYNMIIDAGVTGFISKTATAEQLITAIRCALREEAVIPVHLLKQLRRIEASPSTSEGQETLGYITLSDKEQQILEQVARGLTNNSIALNLGASQRTIEYNLTKIFSKLRVSSRTEALLKAKEFGLLSMQLTEEE